jgi:hypothetical protein
VKVPTRRWPECQECDYRSLDEDEFVVGSDDGFRCNVCDEDREAEREIESDRREMTPKEVATIEAGLGGI